MTHSVIYLAIVTLVGIPPAEAATLYVKVSASGANNGTSWTHAYTDLQDALSAASAGSEIWVAQGVYYPDEGVGHVDDDPTNTFQLKNGVEIYGGFPGSPGDEGNFAVRDAASFITILSGDIVQDDSNPDLNNIAEVYTDITGQNADHVVSANLVDNTAVLDGFTITAGHADGGSEPSNQGGGMLNEGSDPILSNLVLVGNIAADGGGMYNVGGIPRLTNVLFAGNYATDRGGGMRNFYAASPILADVTFTKNSAHVQGGGMANSSASSPSLTNVLFDRNDAGIDGGGMDNLGDCSPRLTNVTFTRNSAEFGAGIRNIYSCAPILTDVTFTSNAAHQHGGGIQNRSDCYPVLTNCTLSGNTAGNLGGGMYCHSSSPQITDCTFYNNSADFGGGMHNEWYSWGFLKFVSFLNNSAASDGGGMRNQEVSNPSMTDVTFRANSASKGGGISNDNSISQLTRCIFSGNAATLSGGAIYSRRSNPRVVDVVFIGNTAGVDGGGMYNNYYSSPRISNSLFLGNTCNGNGGGLFNFDRSRPSLINVLFSGNRARTNGGGIYNLTFSSPSLTNVTLSRNSCDVYGGGLYNFTDSDPVIQNSILWGNSSANGPQIHNDDAASVPQIVNSIIQGGCPDGQTVCSSVLNANPLFADDDGLDGIVGTPDDSLRLNQGSPAIDVGNNTLDPDPNTSPPNVMADILTDLDGRPRIVDGDNNSTSTVDLGPYEFTNEPATPTPTPTPLAPSNDNCSNPVSLSDGTSPFSNVNATTAGPSACGNMARDIWFCYQATCTGNVEISLCGSSFDTVIAVYDGCSCPTGSPMVCNDDSCGLSSQVTFAAVLGDFYLVRVGGYGGVQGSGEISVTCQVPSSTPTSTSTRTPTFTPTVSPTMTPRILCNAPAADFVVRQDGSGDFTTISAAIAAATPGDLILITDGGVYTEDLFISKTLTNLTIEGCPLTPPTIRAANTTPASSRGLFGVIFSAFGASALPDRYGLIVEGDGARLRSVKIENPSSAGNVLFSQSSALAVLADGVTVEDCDIQGTSGSNEGIAVMVATGDWPTLDSTMGGAFAAAGYAGPIDCANLTVTDCVIQGADVNIVALDYATALGILFSGAYIPPMQPTGLWSNMECHGGDALATLAVSDFEFSNCHFHSSGGPFELSGGSTTIHDSTFEMSSETNVIELDAAVGLGGGISEATFENCLICTGATTQTRAVRVDEGIARFSHCIMAHSGVSHSAFSMIQYSPGNIDSDFYLAPPPFVPPDLTSLTIDHCDLFVPTGIGILADDGPVAPEPPANLVVRDSIISANQAISLVASGSVTRAATVEFNDLKSDLQPAIENAGAWALTSAGNLSEDPLYDDPTHCDRPGFLYSNVHLVTASSIGGPVGSQGVTTLTPTPIVSNTPPPTPANDDCLNPLVLSEGTTPFSNLGATTDGIPACGSIGRDIWYCYQASCTGNVEISLCGSAYDTVLAVYDGCGCPTSTAIVCNDDVCGYQSQVVFGVVAGHDYMVRIGGWHGAQGSGQIAVSCLLSGGPTNTWTFTPTPTSSHTPTSTPTPTASFTPASCVASGGVIEVRKDGTGDYTTISAAIAVSGPSDIIQITDNGVYLEDLFIPRTLTNLTIEGACEPSPPTIQAVNATGNRGILGIVFGVAGAAGYPDFSGIIVEGDGTTLRNLRIQNLSLNGNLLVGNSAAVTVMADDVTIEDCDISAAYPSGDSLVGIAVIAGDWPALDPILGIPAFAGSGYTVPIDCSNLVVTDCVIHDSEVNIASVDLATAFALAFTFVYLTPLHPSGSWSRVEVFGGDHLAEITVSDFRFTDCHFHDAMESFELEGGSTTIVDSTFEHSLRSNIIVMEADLGAGGGIAEASFENCLICSDDNNENRVVRVSEGIARFSHCVLKSSGAPNPNLAIIQYSPGDVNSDFFSLPSPFVPPTRTSVTVDHCDIYNPAGFGILGDHPQMAGEPIGALMVTNSIIDAARPVFLAGIAGPVTRSASIHHNDLFTGGAAIDNSLGGWILTEFNNLNQDPIYTFPGTCSKSAHGYLAPALATAGENEAEIGSQGYVGPPVPTRTPTSTITETPTTTPKETETPTISDNDADGIDDSVEDNAPNAGDGNNDGILDSEQENVASLPNPMDGTYITLAAPGGTTLADVGAAHPSSLPVPPAGVVFPVGILTFEIADIAVGQSVVVDIIIPNGVLCDTYFKFGETGVDPSSHWYEFLFDGDVGAEIEPGILHLHLRDGVTGDHDLTANGVISDPGGPAVFLTSSVPNWELYD